MTAFYFERDPKGGGEILWLPADAFDHLSSAAELALSGCIGVQHYIEIVDALGLPYARVHLATRWRRMAQDYPVIHQDQCS